MRYRKKNVAYTLDGKYLKGNINNGFLDDIYFDITDLSPKDTGFTKVILCRTKWTMPEPVIQYRIDDLHALTYTINDNPVRLDDFIDLISEEENERIIEFIKTHEDILLKYWNHTAGSIDLYMGLGYIKEENFICRKKK